MTEGESWWTSNDMMGHYKIGRTTLWRHVRNKVLPKPERLGGVNRWSPDAIRKHDREMSAA